jgi:hypothetical protein
MVRCRSRFRFRHWSPALGVALAAVALPAAPAHAFCGFFVAGSDAKLTNNASQVVLMRKGNRTVMTMSNNYQGPPASFAMVVPVPVVLHKEDVRTLLPDVFDHIDSLSAPRLVEYWEQDPCARPQYDYEEKALESAVEDEAPRRHRKAEDLGVKVEARFVTGEYEVVVLSATESSGLETWLRQNRYSIPAGAASALAPYVRDKSKFFVAKVDIRKVRRDAAGAVQLSPLRFSYDANELRLPVRLGLLNAGGKQDLIVYIVHPTARFEVANYLNAFIPTNLEVGDGVRAAFPAFYAELFDAIVEKMGKRAVVTEYSWQTTSCDPCPVQPLSLDDLSTLGLDVLEGIGAAPEAPAPIAPGTTKPGVTGRVAVVPPPRRFRGSPPSWVLTRLHTRYSPETLSEDLIFREAGPVVGGRGVGIDEDKTATGSSGPNNFQARYIIRHYWTKPVACETPHLGIWGGPVDGSNSASPAKGLATAPRGKVSLAKEVRSSVPLLGLEGQAPPRRLAK